MQVRPFRLCAFFLFLTLISCSQISLPSISIAPNQEPSRVSKKSTPLPNHANELPSDISGDGQAALGPLNPEGNELPPESTQPSAEQVTVESKTVTVTYVVRRGDTLQLIASRAGMTVQQLARLNGIKNINRISAGQVLKLGSKVESRRIVTHPGPAEFLLPDSEILYSPAYKDFNVQSIAENSGGYLLQYRENVEGRMLTGPQIVQLISERFSVGPRVLLTILELRSGWLTGNAPDAARNAYPMGYRQAGWEGLYRQLFWAAERLNAAYYLYQRDELQTLLLFDGDRIRLAPGLNAGTVAVQNLFSRSSSWGTFNEQITNGDFLATYKWLFGSPEQFALKEIVPANLQQPAFRLPWQDGQTWWFTGGPHNAWAPGSEWAAVDFAPSSTRGTCRVASEWVVAVSPGRVIASDIGRVIVDMDGDGFQGTGWGLMYMHVAAKDRVPVGTILNTGDRIGHPSCEGGYSTGTHLHFARMYNGAWIRTDDARAPLNLNGWMYKSTDVHYDGYAVNGNELREACGCRDETKNGIRAVPLQYVENVPALGVTANVSASEQPNAPAANPAVGGANPKPKQAPQPSQTQP